MLTLSGSDFNVDDYLSKSDWGGMEVSVYYKGQKREFSGRFGVFEDSGFSIEASEATFENFEQQQKDIIAFLKKHRNNFELLADYNLDGWHCFDFGLSTYPLNQFSRTYIISSELMKLTSEFHLDIWMSNYFTRNDDYLRRRARKRKRNWPIRKQ